LSVPSRNGRHCDDHPEVELIQRKDDEEETIRKRLEVYRGQTEPLVAHYQKQDVLVHVDGMGNENEVYRALMHAVDCRESKD